MNINLNLLWGLVILVIILNFIIYLTEPLKYTEEDECIKIPCKEVLYCLINLLDIIFDICIIVVSRYTKLGETSRQLSVIFIMLIFF